MNVGLVGVQFRGCRAVSGELVLTSSKWGAHIGFQAFLVVTMSDWQPMMTGIFNYVPPGQNSATESPWHSEVLAGNIQFLVPHELLKLSDVDLTPGENISEVSQVLRTFLSSSTKRPGEVSLMALVTDSPGLATATSYEILCSSVTRQLSPKGHSFHLQ